MVEGFVVLVETVPSGLNNNIEYFVLQLQHNLKELHYDCEIVLRSVRLEACEEVEKDEKCHEHGTFEPHYCKKDILRQF